MDQSKLERLLGVGPALAAGLELEAVLSRIIEAARDITGATYVALGVLDSDGDALERFLTVGLDDDAADAIGDLPRGRGVLGELIRNPRPLRLHDVSQHERSYGFPVGHPPMKNFLGVPIRVRGEVFGNLYLTDKPAHDFDDDDEEVVTRLSEWAGIAIDNARLYGEVRDRHADLERTVEVLETNVEVARAIGSATELEPVLELLAKRGRALVDARGMALALIRGEELVVTNVAGALGEDLIGFRVPWEGAATRRPRTGAPVEVPGELQQLLRRAAGAESGLFVPMVFRNRPLGVIAAIDRQTDGPEFTSNDRRLLTAFAASGAIAVASAQRATQRALRQSIEASERERARWARELHDETLQDLGALRVTLTSARNGGDPDAVAAAVERTIERLGDMSTSLRGLISDLRPAVLDQLGLGPALDTLVNRVATGADVELGLHVDLRSEDGGTAERLSPELELALYRVTQEALTNAIKHAQASRIEVSLVAHEEGLELSIRDNGSGFDPSEDHGGFGLTGIRERIEQNGGTVDVVSTPERGTVISAELPARRASLDSEAAARESDSDRLSRDAAR